MSSVFYKSIIEDEIKAFGMKKDSLIVAVNSVKSTYSRSALTTGTTFLDYNISPNRCAYLYKYALIHTGLVTKYFQKLMQKKEVKSILKREERLKICCLGGGPGNDVVGLFKALALNPNYHQKVVEVTVLDICGGWRNSFKRVISGLVAGEVKDVPASFVDIENFKYKLIEVNLLSNLPSNVVTILSEADIVCMVKFVSAILGYSTAVSALQTIGAKLKTGAIVLFIDNFIGNVFKPLTDIAEHVGLKVVVGPLHESFDKKNGFVKPPTTAAEKLMFGCVPLTSTKVTVLGFIKVAELNTNVTCINETVQDCKYIDEESRQESVNQIPVSETVPKIAYDKFTQIDERYLQQKENSLAGPELACDMGSLMDSLSDLVNVLSQWQQNMEIRRHCCHCHC